MIFGAENLRAVVGCERPQRDVAARHRMGGHGARTEPRCNHVSDAKVREAPMRPVAHRDESVAHQAPRTVVLRAAELVGLVGAVRRRLRAVVRPRQAPARRLPDRALILRRDREDARLPLDDHITHVRRGARDEGDATRETGLDLRADPLGARAALAPPATCENQPRPPRAGGRDLLRARPHRPRGGERRPLAGGELSEDLRPCRWRQRGERACQRGHRQRRPCARASRRRARP